MMKSHKELSRIFAALSNPNRLELFLKIKDHHDLDLRKKQKRTCFLANLCQNWRIGAPTISHHLKELEQAGLVEVAKDGKYTTCSLNSNVLKQLVQVLNES